MKLFTNTLILASALMLSFTVNAASKSDNELLTECKTSISGQIENIENMKVAHMKSRRDLFTAKFRVSASGERSVVVCTIDGDEPVALSCAKGKACGVNTLAAN